MIRNRRQHRRINAYISVLLHDDGRQEYVATRNVSGGGAFVTSLAPPDAGRSVELQFRSARGPSGSVRITGDVIRIVPERTDEPSGFAVRWRRARCDYGAVPLREFLQGVLCINDAWVVAAAEGRAATYDFADAPAVVDHTYEPKTRDTVPISSPDLEAAAASAAAEVAARLGGGRIPEVPGDLPDAPPLGAPAPAAPPPVASKRRPRSTLDGLGAPADIHEEPTIGFDKDEIAAAIAQTDAAQRTHAPAEDEPPAQTAPPHVAEPPPPSTSPGLAWEEDFEDADLLPLSSAPPPPPAPQPRRAPAAISSPVRRSKAGRTAPPEPEIQPPTPQKSPIRKLLNATTRMLGLGGDDDAPKLGRFAVTDEGRFYRPGEEHDPTVDRRAARAAQRPGASPDDDDEQPRGDDEGPT